MKDSKWTHVICLDCWSKREPTREPIRVTDSEEEVCCFCGTKTQAGIYVRAQQTKEMFCNAKPTS